MKKHYLTLIMVIITYVTHGKLRFEKIWPFEENHKDWAMVAKDGYLGFY